MKVSRKFLQEFAYLANRYHWSPEDIEEIKVATRESEELRRYWEILAAAHRAGYEQTPENRFIRLKEWCLQKGLDDPFWQHFDMQSLSYQ